MRKMLRVYWPVPVLMAFQVFLLLLAHPKTPTRGAVRLGGFILTDVFLALGQRWSYRHSEKEREELRRLIAERYR